VLHQDAFVYTDTKFPGVSGSGSSKYPPGSTVRGPSHTSRYNKCVKVNTGKNHICYRKRLSCDGVLSMEAVSSNKKILVLPQFLDIYNTVDL
jgi:hypothetical protein